MNNDIPEQRLRTIYNIVLGANVGFMPIIALYLLTELRTDIGLGTAIAIWILTTAIIVNEWWAALDLWTSCPPIGKSKWWTFYEIFWNMFYVVPLLFLPLSLCLQSPGDITLLPYVIALLSLPCIDLAIVLPYHFNRDLGKYPVEKRHSVVMDYVKSDICAIVLFAAYMVPLEIYKIGSLELIQKIGILAVTYIIEFIIYYRKQIFTSRT